jgi:hypothetical protein
LAVKFDSTQGYFFNFLLIKAPRRIIDLHGPDNKGRIFSRSNTQGPQIGTKEADVANVDCKVGEACICGKFWDNFGFQIEGQVKISSGQQTGQQHAEQKEKTPGNGYFTF